MAAVLLLHQIMQPWREFYTASTISPSFSRKKGATTILLSLHPLSAHQQQQPQQQRRLPPFQKPKCQVYSLFTSSFFCLRVCYLQLYACHGWVSKLCSSSLLSLAQWTWAHSCVCLMYVMQSLTVVNRPFFFFLCSKFILSLFCLNFLQRYSSSCSNLNIGHMDIDNRTWAILIDNFLRLKHAVILENYQNKVIRKRRTPHPGRNRRTFPLFIDIYKHG